MNPILTTDRLFFVPFTLADVPVLATLHGDPEVMRYLSLDGKPWSDEMLRQKVARFVNEQASVGFSKWKVCRRQDEAVIGRAGFSRFKETGELELGFIFRVEAWGKGYATECARGLLDWLFATQPDIGHVIAFAHLENHASRRVLQKVGMAQTGTRIVGGSECAFYRLDRTHWAAHMSQLPDVAASL